MQSKWTIIIIIIALVLLMKSPAKKEARYWYRCSEDNKSIEMYSKITDTGTVWQQCENECQEVNGVPQCFIEETKKEETKEYGFSLLLVAAIILLALFYKKYRRQKNG